VERSTLAARVPLALYKDSKLQGAQIMLRITTLEKPERFTLKLPGQVVGWNVQERRALAEIHSQSCPAFIAHTVLTKCFAEQAGTRNQKHIKEDS